MAVAASDLIRNDFADGILRIQIHRPDKKNALTVAMYAERAAALDRAEREPKARVVLVHGHHASVQQWERHRGLSKPSAAFLKDRTE